MGQFIPLALGLGGAALGANQKTGGTNTTSQTNTTGLSTTMPIEPGYFSDFRKSLVGPYQSYLNNAQKPVYGQAQNAQFLNQSNNLTNSSMNNLASTLATRTGSLNSGAFSKGASDILMNRQSNVSNYNMMTPLLNQQAVMQNMTAALGLGTGWAGKAPLGSTTTDSRQTNFTGTSNTTSGSFLNSLASLLGSGAGNAKGGNPSGGGLFSQDNIAKLFNQPGWFPSGQGVPGVGNYGPSSDNISTSFNPGDIFDPNGYGLNGFGDTIGNIPPGQFSDQTGGNMSGLDWASYFGAGMNDRPSPDYSQFFDPSAMSSMMNSNI